MFRLLLPADALMNPPNVIAACYFPKQLSAVGVLAVLLEGPVNRCRCRRVVHRLVFVDRADVWCMSVRSRAGEMVPRGSFCRKTRRFWTLLPSKPSLASPGLPRASQPLDPPPESPPDAPQTPLRRPSGASLTPP